MEDMFNKFQFCNVKLGIVESENLLVLNNKNPYFGSRKQQVNKLMRTQVLPSFYICVS